METKSGITIDLRFEQSEKQYLGNVSNLSGRTTFSRLDDLENALSPISLIVLGIERNVTLLS
jgi:hypothetical protein